MVRALRILADAHLARKRDPLVSPAPSCAKLSVAFDACGKRR